jgi:SAM-dependent methyltransferase
MSVLFRIALAIGLLASGAVAAAQSRFPAPDRPVSPVISPEYSDERTRDGHGEAERVMNHLGITRGQRVADIGAGYGYYTVRLARRLGAGATIYAQDINPEYLREFESRLRREGLSGVTISLGEAGDPKLPRASIDVAILSHVYHEIENPYEFFYNLHAPWYREGASALSIDFRPSATSVRFPPGAPVPGTNMAHNTNPNTNALATAKSAICSILLLPVGSSPASIHNEFALHAAIAMGAASRLDVAREVERALLRWREFDLGALTRL